MVGAFDPNDPRLKKPMRAGQTPPNNGASAAASMPNQIAPQGGATQAGANAFLPKSTGATGGGFGRAMPQLGGGAAGGAAMPPGMQAGANTATGKGGGGAGGAMPIPQGMTQQNTNQTMAGASTPQSDAIGNFQRNALGGGLQGGARMPPGMQAGANTATGKGGAGGNVGPQAGGQTRIDDYASPQGGQGPANAATDKGGQQGGGYNPTPDPNNGYKGPNAYGSPEEASAAWNAAHGNNPNPFGLKGSTQTTYTKIDPATGRTYETSDAGGGPPPQGGGGQGPSNTATDKGGAKNNIVSQGDTASPKQGDFQNTGMTGVWNPGPEYIKQQQEYAASPQGQNAAKWDKEHPGIIANAPNNIQRSTNPDGTPHFDAINGDPKAKEWVDKFNAGQFDQMPHAMASDNHLGDNPVPVGGAPTVAPQQPQQPQPGGMQQLTPQQEAAQRSVARRRAR